MDKIEKSIERLKAFEPSDGYYLAFSGGKDSICIKQLTIEAGVKFDSHYQVTTIDPPELVHYIKREHPDVKWERPEIPFLTRLATKGFPIRQGRWCCEYYKECGGGGRTVMTGIRWAESYTRKERKMVEHCFRDKTKRYVHPIIDWSKDDVWDFIHDRNLPYCSLYDEGYKRLGCLFCPMQYYKSRMKEVRRYPGYEKAFRKAFRKLYTLRKEQGRKSVDRWKNGDEMFEWWITEGKGTL